MKKKFYIKERSNPQFKQPYFIACGQLSKKEAKAKENSIYGTNYMVAYDTEDEYILAIETLRMDGFSVR